MADFNNAIIGLQDFIGDQKLSSFDQFAQSFAQQVTGQGYSSPIKSGNVNKKTLIWQIDGLPKKFQSPVLVMDINPTQLDSSYSQLINRKRTLGGHIEEHWGEQLDELSSSGITGSFYGPYGLTNQERRSTAAFQSFEKFVNIYRNNGSVYDTRTSKIIAQGSVIMNYDESIYRGYFESLTINETGDKQFNLHYDFTFKVTEEIFPGRIKSFRSVTTVSKPGVLKNDNITLDVTT
ncbi:MAG: hypothetical protein Q7R33_01965 [Nitrosarchaeum sp.]|nr:hypothetical protein [Nitrosarchaeum sp.]